MRICLVACSKSKQTQQCSAEHLYNSTLFKASREFAVNCCDEWKILSALHGLVAPYSNISPYDKGMPKHDSPEQKVWAEKVMTDLRRKYKLGTIITFLAGEKYVKPLCRSMLAYGYKIGLPLKGKGIGKRVKWLNHANQSGNCLKHLDRLYDLLNRVISSQGDGLKTLNEYLNERHTHKKGVYFFYDPDEFRLTLQNQNRIVRVGTHAVSKGSKSTITNRLRQHRGTLDGLGNHRGSIFRLHVGNALLRRDNLVNSYPTWGVRQNATKKVRLSETELENSVSDYIGKLLVAGVEIHDESGPSSDRAYIERNAIGLLTKASEFLDCPSESWLGMHSVRDVIRCSGLWNLEHVGYQYDPKFLDVLETHIDSMLGNTPKIVNSIAPEDWYLNQRQKFDKK